MLIRQYYCDKCKEKFLTENNESFVEEHVTEFTVKVGEETYHLCSSCLYHLRAYMDTALNVQVESNAQQETTVRANKPRSYCRFTEDEKETIIRYTEEGKTISWIANKLNRNFASVQKIINMWESKAEEFEQVQAETDMKNRKAFIDSGNLNEVISAQKSEESAVLTADMQKTICRLVKWKGKSKAEVAELMHVTIEDVTKALNLYL